ncbi:peroxiredoxin-like family protein [Geothrix sp. 21YS21S-2]|uniref:peroxiredoxin-like family protein n=1 Tax=Geothrix sp. 21YS21S-2 TaxID=3068893 RepID=UPI0027B8F63C|nr:peroxiredoxin-like family protein [Geothrix sp. 21YS21S-2]
MALQEDLNTFMAGVRTQLPAEVLAPVERFYAELDKPDRFPYLLHIGERAPMFTLPDATGKIVSTEALLAKGPLVISFYRGAWCPFCNLELRALQTALPEILALGATLIAISPEKPDYAMPLIERESLAFPVLSDLGNKVARSFGLVYTLEGEARRISLDTFGTDLPKFNGDDSWELPVPATFVLERNGKARLVFFDPEFRNRVDPALILSTLRDLQQACV